jgi:hypothetical protein
MYKAIVEKIYDKVKVGFAKTDGSYYDKELFSSSILLKNLSLVRQEAPLSADYIYENLMNNSIFLKSIYGEMLTLYRSGKDEEAFNVLGEVVGTKAARSFGVILSKLDKINPAELTEQMDIFRTMMIEKRATAAVKRTQRNSFIITTISSAAVFALLINFVVVVVFMDTLKLLSNLFA